MKSGRLLQASVILILAISLACVANAKEPYASADEYEKYIVSQENLPWTELVKGANTRLVWGDKVMVSFITMSPWSVFPSHTHEAEQIMIVLDGYMDEMIDGKLYRIKKGDVIKLPSNIPHGGYLYDVPCKAIDVFVPVRPDYVEKTKEQGTYGVTIPR